MKSSKSLSASKLRLNPVTVAVAAAIGSSFALPEVRAQDVDSVQEVIVVTASRRETLVQDAPYTVTALSGADLERNRLTGLTAVARFVPGLTVVEQGARGTDLMTYRGLNVRSMDANDFLDNSSGGTVQTYLGEIPIYLDLKMTDVERVEFLAGPQGTFYGAGTLGGAVRYIPKAPDLDTFSIGVHGDIYDVSHSDDAGYETDAVINVPLIDGKLAFRGSFYYLDDPGFIDYPYLLRNPGVSNPEPDLSDSAAVAANLYRMSDANTENVDSSRLALLYQATDNVSATFSYYNQEARSGGRSVSHADSFGAGPYESAHRFLEPDNRETSLFSVEIDADFGFATLTSATGISDYEQSGQRDQTDFYLYQGWGYETFPEFSSYTRELAKEDRLSEELRLVSNGDGKISWIAGVFYNDFDIDSSSREFMPGFADSDVGVGWGLAGAGELSYMQTNADTLTEKALFGEVSYAFTDRLELTVGGRLFDYETRQLASFSIPFLDIDGSEEILNDDDGTLGKLSVSYRFSDSFLGYATFSQGYRIGGANSVPPCAVPLPVNASCALPDEVRIEPDRTDNLEFGAHLILGRNITLDAAVYSIDWDGLQTAGTTANGDLQITVNGGSARSRGAEFSLAAGGAGPWSIRTTYAYTDAKLTRDAPGLFTGDDAYDGADAFKGDRLSATPEHQVGFELRNRRVLNNGWDLDVSYGVTTTSDVLTKVGMRSGGERLAGYSIHSASIRLSRDQWSATLYADNLTDKYASTSVRMDPSAIFDSGGFAVRRYYRNVLRPRTIGLEFRYSIGE